jgi:hypothetical protein
MHCVMQWVMYGVMVTLHEIQNLTSCKHHAYVFSITFVGIIKNVCKEDE